MDKVAEVVTPGVTYIFCVCVPLPCTLGLLCGIKVDPDEAGVVYTVCMVGAVEVAVAVVGATLKAKRGKASAVMLLDRICMLLLLLLLLFEGDVSCWGGGGSLAGNGNGLASNASCGSCSCEGCGGIL